jgi:cyclopropane fatty-acyl-phospholipid synthase-like methyltransferase
MTASWFRDIHTGKILKHVKQNKIKLDLKGESRILNITLGWGRNSALVISYYSLTSDGSKLSFFK